MIVCRKRVKKSTTSREEQYWWAGLQERDCNKSMFEFWLRQKKTESRKREFLPNTVDSQTGLKFQSIITQLLLEERLMTVCVRTAQFALGLGENYWLIH